MGDTSDQVTEYGLSPSNIEEDTANSNKCLKSTEIGRVDNNQRCNYAEAFATALRSYPVVLSIVRHLDLNSLHDLSATCSQFRNSLLLHRSQLLRQTLRCVNDDGDAMHRQSSEQRPRASASYSRSHSVARNSRIVNDCRGKCARDLVAECRRCGTNVCRLLFHLYVQKNCIIKSPSRTFLRQRHRRLCNLCQHAPLRHMVYYRYNNSFDGLENCFTSKAFYRGSCTCLRFSYICVPCGNATRSADTTYMRGWTWRTRYSTYLGGIGTGIGEGSEGVHCGRGKDCLAAKELEKEIDCDADELFALRALELSSTPGRQWAPGASYLTQEIEGIGGIVKKKVKKRVRVGSVVKEYEDERYNGTYLRREHNGLLRSWCHWCSRVILGQDDLETYSSGTFRSGLNALK